MADSTCKFCKGTGWRQAPDGVSVARCNCNSPIERVDRQFELSALPERERQVYQALKFHRGAENAILQSHLAHKLSMSRREVGSLVQSLIINYGVAIASNCGKRSGYYLIETDHECKLAATNLMNRAEWLVARLHALNPRLCREFLERLISG